MRQHSPFSIYASRACLTWKVICKHVARRPDLLRLAPIRGNSTRQNRFSGLPHSCSLQHITTTLTIEPCLQVLANPAASSSPAVTPFEQTDTNVYQAHRQRERVWRRGSMSWWISCCMMWRLLGVMVCCATPQFMFFIESFSED